MITNQYSYNGDGQRVQVIDSQGTKKQIWDGENVLVETDGAGSTQAVYTLEPAGYGNLVSQRRASTTSTYLFDALGSTRKLTNSASAVTDSYDYRAYGETFASSGSTTNVFRWVGMLGYYFDVDRSAYYVRARHYSPKQARWISQDPIGFDGSKWNLYEYAIGRPPLFADPAGEATCGSHSATVTASIGPGDIEYDFIGCAALPDWLARRQINNVLAQYFPMSSTRSSGCPSGTKCCILTQGIAAASVSATIQFTIGACTMKIPITVTATATGSFGLCAPLNCPCPPTITGVLPPIILPIGGPFNIPW